MFNQKHKIGDLKNSLARCQRALRESDVPCSDLLEALKRGAPQTCIELLRRLLISSRAAISQAVARGMYPGVPDRKIVIGTYDILRDLAHYNPTITVDQFFHKEMFAEHKLHVITALAEHLLQFSGDDRDPSGALLVPRHGNREQRDAGFGSSAHSSSGSSSGRGKDSPGAPLTSSRGESSEAAAAAEKGGAHQPLPLSLPLPHSASQPGPYDTAAAGAGTGTAASSASARDEKRSYSAKRDVHVPVSVPEDGILIRRASINVPPPMATNGTAPQPLSASQAAAMAAPPPPQQQPRSIPLPVPLPTRDHGELSAGPLTHSAARQPLSVGHDSLAGGAGGGEGGYGDGAPVGKGGAHLPPPPPPPLTGAHHIAPTPTPTTAATAHAYVPAPAPPPKGSHAPTPEARPALTAQELAEALSQAAGKAEAGGGGGGGGGSLLSLPFTSGDEGYSRLYQQRQMQQWREEMQFQLYQQHVRSLQTPLYAAAAAPVQLPLPLALLGSPQQQQQQQQHASFATYMDSSPSPGRSYIPTAGPAADSHDAETVRYTPSSAGVGVGGGTGTSPSPAAISPLASLMAAAATPLAPSAAHAMTPAAAAAVAVGRPHIGAIADKYRVTAPVTVTALTVTEPTSTSAASTPARPSTAAVAATPPSSSSSSYSSSSSSSSLHSSIRSNTPFESPMPPLPVIGLGPGSIQGPSIVGQGGQVDTLYSPYPHPVTSTATATAAASVPTSSGLMPPSRWMQRALDVDAAAPVTPAASAAAGHTHLRSPADYQTSTLSPVVATASKGGYSYGLGDVSDGAAAGAASSGRGFADTLLQRMESRLVARLLLETDSAVRQALTSFQLDVRQAIHGLALDVDRCVSHLEARIDLLEGTAARAAVSEVRDREHWEHIMQSQSQSQAYGR